jgi:hypothetical protein
MRCLRSDKIYLFEMINYNENGSAFYYLSRRYCVFFRKRLEKYKKIWQIIVSLEIKFAKISRSSKVAL